MKNNDASSLLPKQPELFTPDGHLTDQAFSLLLSEQLDQLQSLEVSEHLSFCDKCLDRYTSLLCGEISLDSDKSIELSPEEPILSQPAADHLIEPPPQLLPSVMKQLAHRSRVFYLHKFTSLAVAASLALVFWTGGIFSNGRLSGAVNSLVNDLQSNDFRAYGKYFARCQRLFQFHPKPTVGMELFLIRSQAIGPDFLYG